jgi:hypothetical protein
MMMVISWHERNHWMGGPAGLPPLCVRLMNYRIVQGSKHARAADAVALIVLAE